MKIFDISRPLNNDLAEWPGDAPFHFEFTKRIASGDVVNLGKIDMSVHNGTHADGWFHFDAQAETVDRVPLENFFGRAVVVDLSTKFSSGARDEIKIVDLESVAESLKEAPRLLIRTGIWRDSTIFPDWIPVLAQDVPAWLQARGVKLLGVDVPSVDAIDAKVLRTHHALYAARIAIVESLDLSEIEAGVYNFAALPLKIIGGDGAPVRAILWRD
ncbi:MAG: arylformamidase [Verrucomicrobiota bacterium]|jgi:arylformamidase